MKGNQALAAPLSRADERIRHGRLIPDEGPGEGPPSSGARLQLKRLQDEIALAAEIQRYLLPVRIPQPHPFEIAADYQPCHVLGGDFYDFFPWGGGTCVALGDVSGKGLPASLRMASLRASLRAHAAGLPDLGAILAMVNADLIRDTRDHEFATLFLGVLDPLARRLTYTSAGHEPAVLVRDGESTALASDGMALGIDEDQTFETTTLLLAPGDALAVVSDGVTEAKDAEDLMFGRPRLLQSLRRDARRSARRLCDDLLNELHWFRGGEPASDDVTLVTLRVAAA